MSFSVAVTLNPPPVGAEAAWDWVSAERRVAGPVSPEFLTLIDLLTARYPCICDLRSTEGVGVWTDGPLRNNAGHRVTVLGICSQYVETVLPFLIEAATSLGLSVYDFQTGAVHRP